jgi:hypothetical protein
MHREWRQISLEDAAKGLNVDTITLAAYERGLRRAPPEVVYEAALLFGCLISDIMHDL